MFGVAYAKIAHSTCSATTIQDCHDDGINLGVFAALEQLCLDAYDRIVGLELEHVTSMGTSPCGGEAAGKSPVDPGKQGTKRVLLSDGAGHPIGLRGRARELARLGLPPPNPGEAGGIETRFGVGVPEHIMVHLDAGFDSTRTRDLLDELGCNGMMSIKDIPLQAADTGSSSAPTPGTTAAYRDPINPGRAALIQSELTPAAAARPAAATAAGKQPAAPPPSPSRSSQRGSRNGCSAHRTTAQLHSAISETKCAAARVT